jgi:hypothetical protein
MIKRSNSMNCSTRGLALEDGPDKEDAVAEEFPQEFIEGEKAAKDGLANSQGTMLELHARGILQRLWQLLVTTF